jgi:hypothetical protein
MFYQKRKFKNSKGLTLSAIYEGKDKNAPVVVLCHGYGSSKNTESIKLLVKKLVPAGVSIYRFDFLGCGESEGTLKDLTPKEGVDDLEQAVKNLNKKVFALYGSSFGGYVALGYACHNTVLALGLKAPVSDYPAVIDLVGNEKEHKSTGFLSQANNIDIYSFASNIKAPTLIVHGSKDDTVPLEHSEKLLNYLGGEKRLAIIHGATHDIKGASLEDATTQLSEFFINQLL